MAKSKVTDEALNNRLLAALPEGEFKKILPALTEVNFEVDDVLWEADEKGRYLYFPTTALVFLLYEAADGAAAGIGTIGREGVAGINLVLGDVRTPERAVIQHAGTAFKMKAADVQDEFAECGDFQDILVSYTQAFLSQVSQNVICNRLHTVEQQLCRWLLVSHDHLRESVFPTTQNQIAAVLGVRRESVSMAAADLHKRDLINGTRGKIEIRNKDGIQAASCECYAVVKDQYDRIMKSYRSEHHS